MFIALGENQPMTDFTGFFLCVRNGNKIDLNSSFLLVQGNDFWSAIAKLKGDLKVVGRRLYLVISQPNALYERDPDVASNARFQVGRCSIVPPVCSGFR